MYLWKNACKNITRNKGRNIVIMITMTTIITSVIVSFYINATSITLMEQVREVHGTEVAIVTNVERSMAANEAFMKENDYKKNSQGFVESFVFPIPSYKDKELYAKSQYVKEVNVSYSFAYESDNLSVLDEAGNDYYNSHNPFPEMGERVKIYSLGKLSAYKNFEGASNEHFFSGMRKLQEGNAPKNAKECIISYELAQLNHLSVQDNITIRQSTFQKENKMPELTLTITGIYFDGTQADTRKDELWGMGENTEEDQEPLVPSRNRRNEIITTEQTIIEYASLLEAREDTIEDEFVERGIFYEYFYLLDDVTHLEAFEQEAYEKGLHSTYDMAVVNEYKYNQVYAPVMEIGKVSDLFMVSIISFGACLLILISFLLIRLRTYEIGVLNAMGLRKLHIAKMFLWESLLLTFVSLCASFVIGMSLGNVVTDNLIEQELETSMKNIDHEDLKDVEINISIANYVAIVGVTMMLGMVTSIAGVAYTMRFEPRKILSNQE